MFVNVDRLVHGSVCRDKRLAAKVPFSCLSKAETTRDRIELARNLLDVLVSKEEQGSCNVSGKVSGRGTLDMQSQIECSETYGYMCLNQTSRLLF